MLELDHVILVVDDLATAAQRLYDEHGLASAEGGRHPGHGTGNRIVPLGNDYLELMAVVDAAEAATSPLGAWVAERAGPDPVAAAVCIRTDDIDAVAGRLGLEAEPMSRRRPDGATLSWRLCGLAEALSPEALPFFIQWDIDPEDHPGRTEVDHAVAPVGIARVEIGGGPASLAQRLDGADLPIRAVGGRPGIGRVAVSTQGGDLVLPG